MRRFTVPVKGEVNEVKWEDVNMWGMGLHAIHPMLKGKKHRYAWSPANKGEGVWWNALVKIDMKKGDDASIIWYQEDHYPSEVSFIPRPGATEEDDGVVVSVVMGNDGETGTSYLLVLDAKDMTEISRVPAPVFLPFPSHGHTCATVEGEKMCFWA